MSRLLIVSNRVPDMSNPAQAGGLASGLADAVVQREVLWFGWDGKVVKSPVSPAPEVTTDGSLRRATIPLSQRDHDEYYAGFANRVLWPVFHYRLDLVQYERRYLSGYRRVNTKFADMLVPLLLADDIIWIHDYHLIPLAAELRRRGCKQRIGFFLHIPFPPEDILAAAPEHQWLTRCLLQYDTIGFQTQADLNNFRNYVTNWLGGSWSEYGDITVRQRKTVAMAFPIGIDVDNFHAMATTEEADAQISLLQRRLVARTHIIGVERLDYTKGIPARLKAFGRLLEKHPENIKAVSLMQIASPTREEVQAYLDIKAELESLSGQINGAFADFDWTPVRYINRSIPRSTLAALYRGSQIGFVTPYRDGMNLVAKEYVAAQDENDPGVLILSSFAGAAEQMKEALLVNPYNIDEMADALQQAITMPLGERRERHAGLLRGIREHDARHWQRSFLDVLSQTGLELAA